MSTTTPASDSSTPSKLDQIVKGAPPPDISPTQIAESAKNPSSTFSARPSPQLPPTLSAAAAASSHIPINANITVTDPRESLPSSPPQIYLNLLILESSLRLQYLSLRARLRVNVLLLVTLLVWNFTFTYLLFFRPREDGSGVGGSVYWVLETIEKLGWCSGIVTLCLFWGTGMYDRGVRWPRKFIGTTNRGLRGFNLKVVVVKGSFWSELKGWMGMLDPAGWVREERVQFQVLPKDIENSAGISGVASGKEHWNAHVARHGLVEEDIAASGDVLKLLLLPKPFSPDFREGWENYRMEYWERENGRRAELRRLYKARIHEVARREGGSFWRLGWRGWKNFRLTAGVGKTRRQIELEKLALRERPSMDHLIREKERAKRNSALLGLSGQHTSHSRSNSTHSHSRSSSRSTTPTPEPELRRGASEHEKARRRGSSAGSQRRLKKAGGGGTSRLSATESIMQDAEIPQPLSKRSSTLSADGEEVKREEIGVGIKREGSVEG